MSAGRALLLLLLLLLLQLPGCSDVMDR